MIDNRSVQHALAAKGYYVGKIDGIIGAKSKHAIRDGVTAANIGPIGAKGWDDDRCRIAFEQLMMRDAGINVGAIDGRIGPQTLFAQEQWQNLQRSLPTYDNHHPEIWPRQADVRSVFGEPGKNMIGMKLPYEMRLAWDPATSIDRIVIHAKVAESAHACLAAELAHYGKERIRALGLDLFGGCYSDRAMRGGTAKSMHAWAIALDRNPNANPLRADHRTAAFARPEYAALHAIWEGAGWINLGRERDFDWMHFQAARI